jgi:hypothetical protein
MRFEPATDEAKSLLKEVQAEHFPELLNANILLLFDTKKRVSGGKVVLGRIQKTNDLLRHLTIEEARDDDGFDYIIYLDKVAFDNIVKEDRIRLIRHELKHILYDPDNEVNPYKIQPHDIEDFIDEIKLNVDDPGWAQRVAELTASIYEQIRDQEE